MRANCRYCNCITDSGDHADKNACIAALKLRWGREIPANDDLCEMPADLHESHKDMDLLQHDLGQWSDATFGVDDRRGGMIAHLRKEYKEFLEAVDSGYSFEVVVEAVDMSLLLMDIVRVSRYSLHDEMRKKLETLKVRSWQPMAADGSVEHVRDG